MACSCSARARAATGGDQVACWQSHAEHRLKESSVHDVPRNRGQRLLSGTSMHEQDRTCMLYQGNAPWMLSKVTHSSQVLERVGFEPKLGARTCGAAGIQCAV